MLYLHHIFQLFLWVSPLDQLVMFCSFVFKWFGIHLDKTKHQTYHQQNRTKHIYNNQEKTEQQKYYDTKNQQQTISIVCFSKIFGTNILLKLCVLKLKFFITIAGKLGFLMYWRKFSTLWKILSSYIRIVIRWKDRGRFPWRGYTADY